MAFGSGFMTFVVVLLLVRLAEQMIDRIISSSFVNGYFLQLRIYAMITS